MFQFLEKLLIDENKFTSLIIHVSFVPRGALILWEIFYTFPKVEKKIKSKTTTKKIVTNRFYFQKKLASKKKLDPTVGVSWPTGKVDLTGFYRSCKANWIQLLLTHSLDWWKIAFELPVFGLN